LKRSTSRITNQELFVDPYFDVNSLNISSTEKITWLRPKDLVSKPKLGSSSTNYKDVLQGRLDNCALLSACSSIASYPHLVKQVYTFVFFYEKKIILLYLFVKKRSLKTIQSFTMKITAGL
jgi:hypothetical protein